MPMPHRTQQQLIKRRLVGKDGAERIRELRAILAELPGYRNGPYADLRKWVEGELAAARTRKRVVHRDSIAVRRRPRVPGCACCRSRYSTTRASTDCAKSCGR